MSKSNLILVRHGQSEWNKLDQFTGWVDVGLSKKGIEEAKNALNFENAIVGINNRNLETLNVDISNTYKLHKILLNHTGPLICESGIKTEKDVEEIVKKTKINNFLIGESLLKDLDKNSSLLKNITQIRA